MTPQEFCPFSVPAPIWHFANKPLFAEGESSSWDLATLKQRLLVAATCYIQSNHEMQIGPWHERRRAEGTRDCNLSDFIQTFQAVADSDRFRTAVLAHYGTDISFSAINCIIIDLVRSSKASLTVATAEKLNLGEAADRIAEMSARKSDPVSAPTNAPSPSNLTPDRPAARSVAGLLDEATRAFASERSRTWLVAFRAGLTFNRPDNDGELLIEANPNYGKVIDGVLRLPVRCVTALGEVNLGQSGPRISFLIDGDGDGVRRFYEFSRRAGAELLANPPAWAKFSGYAKSATLWAMAIMFASPKSRKEHPEWIGDCRIESEPWGASCAALHSWSAVPLGDGPSGRDREEQSSIPDGLGANGKFWFRGKEVRFGRGALRRNLVLALWDNDKRQPIGQQAIEVVVTKVWGDNHDTTDSAFRQLCADTNQQVFERDAHPLRIVNQVGFTRLEVDPQ